MFDPGAAEAGPLFVTKRSALCAAALAARSSDKTNTPSARGARNDIISLLPAAGRGLHQLLKRSVVASLRFGDGFVRNLPLIDVDALGETGVGDRLREPDARDLARVRQRGIRQRDGRR